MLGTNVCSATTKAVNHDTDARCGALRDRNQRLTRPAIRPSVWAAKKRQSGMENQIRGLEATRREFLWSSSILAGALALPAGLLNVASAIAAGEIKDVPRNRTLVTVRGGREGKHTEHELWSPYVIGSNPQLGGNIIYEPLAFYSAFADKELFGWRRATRTATTTRSLRSRPAPGSIGATASRFRPRTWPIR